MQIQAQNHTNPFTEQVSVSVAPVATVSFQFQNRPVRVVLNDGVEYFVAKDLAPILGYSHIREAVRTRVDKRDRCTVRNPDATSAGGNPVLLAVNESGVYSLAFGSSNPEALEFRRWVTNEVLPSIRKTGKYEIKQQPPPLLEQVTAMLRGRGVAKERQLNRIIAHRKTRDVSFRIGKRWIRHVLPADLCNLPQSHSLREGLVLSAIHAAQKAERRPLTS